MNYEELKAQVEALYKKREELNGQLWPLEDQIRELVGQRDSAKKQLILENAGLTEEQVKNIAERLTRSREIRVYFDEIGENSECEDDGFIHVTRRGIRFCKEGSESQLASFARNVEREMAKETGKWEEAQ